MMHGQSHYLTLLPEFCHSTVLHYADLTASETRSVRLSVDVISAKAFVYLLRARAMALEHGLNTILLPILECMEQLLTRGCQLGSCMATWETARISHLPRLVEAACQGNTQLGSLAQLREATSGMLRVLHAMSVAGEKAQVSSQCAECAACICSRCSV